MSKQTFKKFYGIARTVAAGSVRTEWDYEAARPVISGIQGLDMFEACGRPVGEGRSFDAATSALAAREYFNAPAKTTAERRAVDFYQYD